MDGQPEAKKPKVDSDAPASLMNLIARPETKIDEDWQTIQTEEASEADSLGAEGSKGPDPTTNALSGPESGGPVPPDNVDEDLVGDGSATIDPMVESHTSEIESARQSVERLLGDAKERESELKDGGEQNIGMTKGQEGKIVTKAEQNMLAKDW